MQEDSTTSDQAAAHQLDDLITTARALKFRLEDEYFYPSLDWEGRLEIAGLAGLIIAGLTQLRGEGSSSS